MSHLLASTSLIINSLPFPKGTRTRFRRQAGAALGRAYEAGEGVRARGEIRECDGAEASDGLVGGEGAGQ